METGGRFESGVYRGYPQSYFIEPVALEVQGALNAALVSTHLDGGWDSILGTIF